MRFKLSSFCDCAALMLAAAAVMGLVSANAGPAGDKIQFSAPSNPTVASNLNQLDPRQSTFKQVQEDLFKPFKRSDSIFNRNEEDGLPSPPQVAPPVLDKRTQEMIEKRRNWAFADWNDLFPDPVAEELSKEGNNSRDKKPVSLIDRYFEGLNQKTPTATNRFNAIDRFSQAFAGTNTFDPSGETFTAEGQFNKIMKHIFNPSAADKSDKNVIDFDRPVYRMSTADEIAEQKRKFEDFQQILDPHLAATPTNTLNTVGQAGVYDPANLFNSMQQHRNPVNPAMTVADPTAKAFYSHVYDDPTALALGLTNNLLTPRPVTPLVPTPSLDPLDNFPKRKF